MAADFLTPERKKKNNYSEKLIPKKIQKTFIVNNDNKIICARYLREAPAKHTYLPKKIAVFPLKIVRN